MIIKVKFLKNRFSYKAADVVELPAEEANELIAKGYAEKVEETAEDLAKSVASELSAQIKSEVKTQVAEIAKGLKSTASISVGPSDVEKDEKRGFKHFGDYAVALRKSAMGEGIDPRLEKFWNYAGQKAASGLVGGDSDPQAAGTMPEQFAAEIARIANTTGNIQQYVRSFPLSVGRNLKIPVHADYDRSSVTASARLTDVALTDTAAGRSAITASKTNHETVTLSLNSRAILTYATDELLADNGVALGTFLTTTIGEELTNVVNKGIIAGVASFADGIIGHASALAVTRDTVGVIKTADIALMRSRFYGNYNNAVWVTSHSGYSNVLTLTLGNFAMFTPQGVNGAPTDMLYGRPLIVSEYAADLGTAGDILLMDGSKYYAATKGGVELAESIHLKFDTAETAFRGIVRFDGRPIFSSTFTLENGVTVSPFVHLDTLGTD